MSKAETKYKLFDILSYLHFLDCSKENLNCKECPLLLSDNQCLGYLADDALRNYVERVLDHE